jgi:hypothetical protein
VNTAAKNEPHELVVARSTCWLTLRRGRDARTRCGHSPRKQSPGDAGTKLVPRAAPGTEVVSDSLEKKSASISVRGKVTPGSRAVGVVRVVGVPVRALEGGSRAELALFGPAPLDPLGAPPYGAARGGFHPLRHFRL